MGTFTSIKKPSGEGRLKLKRREREREGERKKIFGEPGVHLTSA
jgi:hypothetical protein